MGKVKDIRINDKADTPEAPILYTCNIKSDWYKAIIHRSTEGFLLIKHPEGDILDVNDAFCNMLGYNRKELLSMNIKDIEEGYDKSSEAIQKRSDDIEKVETTSFETRHSCKDGRIIDVSVNLRYLKEGVCFCFYRDITVHKGEQEKEQLNLKHVKETLKEAEDRYRTIIELGTKVGEAVIMLQDVNGREGIHKYVSDQWLNITGYSREELLNMSFFNLVIPEDRKAAIQRHRQKMSGETIPDLIELYITHKGGNKVPIEITSGATSYKSQPANVVYIRDITARKQAEQLLKNERDKYKILLEHTPIAIWEHDLSGGMHIINKLKRSGITNLENYFYDHLNEFMQFLSLSKIINANPASRNVYGNTIIFDFNNIQNKTAKRIVDLNNENEILFFKGIINPFTQMIEGCSEIPVNEYPVPTIDGKPKYVRASFSVAPGHDHELSLVFGAAIDITDRVMAEKDILEYKNHLESMVKERTNELNASLKREKKLNQKLEMKVTQQDEFIRRLVHDLKTPLSPLLLASEMMVDSLHENTLKRIAVNINRGAIQLNNSVNDLVDIVRGEIGTIQLNYKETDLGELLSEIIEYFNFEADRKGQKLHLNYKNNLPIIYADRERLKQVIINLLENAMRYTPPKGSITIKAKSIKENIIVEIIDTGCGIKDKDLPYLFNSNYTTENYTSRHDGLGLGLQLSKMLIELHHGTIWAKNVPGKGANFGFSIPVKYIDKLKLENV